MPELPEVEVVCRFLACNIVGLEVAKVFVLRRDLRQLIPENLSQLLEGARIEKVVRRAKYIQCMLSNSVILLIHLGMSGRLLFGKFAENSKHDHVILHFNDGNMLKFNDPRRFGLVSVREGDGFFANLGIEPLSDEFTVAGLSDMIVQKKCNIKSFLLNNKNIVGIGNIYASEILFRAKISPLRMVMGLSSLEIEKLHTEIQEVLEEAILAGGSTLKDYAIPDGEIGEFQKNFAVYSKKAQPCINCSAEILKISQGGRSTFYCSKCQI